MAVYLMPVESGRPIVLDKAVIFIGRHPECDVVIKHSRKVSRKHCCLAVVDTRLMIRDLGSMNGIRVNGRRVRKEAGLRLGDEVLIGDIAYVVRDGAASVPEGGAPRRASKAGPKKPQRVPPPVSPAPPPVPRSPAIPPPRLPVDISHEYPVPIPDEDEIVDLGAQKMEWKETPRHDSSGSDEPIILSDSGEH